MRPVLVLAICLSVPTIGTHRRIRLAQPAGRLFDRSEWESTSNHVSGGQGDDRSVNAELIHLFSAAKGYLRFIGIVEDHITLVLKESPRPGGDISDSPTLGPTVGGRSTESPGSSSVNQGIAGARKDGRKTPPVEDSRIGLISML